MFKCKKCGTFYPFDVPEEIKQDEKTVLLCRYCATEHRKKELEKRKNGA